MTPILLLSVFLLYTLMLFVISLLTTKKANNDSFFSGNKVSPWYVVAYGMIGASLSGVTFISVPGAVGNDGFSYMVMVFGYFIGYLIIIKILLPVYYKLDVASIYSYFNNRFGIYAYKSGATYFLISRIIGSSFRMFIVISVLQYFVFSAWNIPFWMTTLIFIILILLYTFKGGIKTIVWTDTLQTTFMLAAVIITIFFIINHLSISITDLIDKVRTSDYSQMIISDWRHPKNFIKQFISGAFMSIVMTGMDQDMMQKNLTCRSLKDSQKNMFWLSFSLIPINLLFLFLGATLFIFANQVGLSIPAKADTLYPLIAFNHLGIIGGLTFILGLIAAAYSSADSAMTALTTSFSIDILNINKKGKYSDNEKVALRKKVHLAIAVATFLVILLFNAINKDSVINELFTIAGYTYGPILGLFSFGLMTKYQVHQKLIIPVVILAPILSFLIDNYSKQLFNGYEFGFELLIINGLLTFIGLFLIRKMPRIIPQ